MNDDLKYLIVAKLDVLEFLDILGLDFEDIIDKFEEEIENEKEQLLAACR